MVLAHALFQSTEGSPFPAWFTDVVLVGAPLLVLCVALLVLEARTRPDDPRHPRPQESPR